MGIEQESHLDHPVDTVWDWHTRPGAMPGWFRRGSP